MGPVLWATVLVLFTTVFLAILQVLWVGLSWYYLTPKKIERAMARQGIRGPRPQFLVGSILDVASMMRDSTRMDMAEVSHDIVPRLMPHLLLWSKQYGLPFLFWYGSEPRLCLTDIDMVREFLSSKNIAATGRSWMQVQGAKDLIGRGLLMANGADWFHQRHVVGPAFQGDKLKGYLGYMVESTMSMLKCLDDVVARSASGELEIGAYMMQVTGDIISRTGFGSSYEKGNRIFQLLGSLQSLTAQSSRHLWLPGSRLFPSKYKKEIQHLKNDIERLLMEIIQTRIDRVEIGRSSSYGNDLLGMLLAEAQKYKEGLNVTMQLLMDQCKTIYFAGHDTSALLLTWTTMLLATNPEWQEKARDEVLEVCGKEPPTMDHLPKLTILHMIINESLRLYPPVSILPRMVFQDIQLGDLTIPKGISVWIPALEINHNKQLWGDDADKFDPDRWSTGRRTSSQLRNFLPFSAGPRNCLGQAFAMMEAKVILAMLLSRFSFTLSKNYRHAPISVLTLKPKHGVQINIKLLSSSQ